MKFLPRHTFDTWVTQYKADKYSKGFTCWNLLLALSCAQLSGATSLRTLEARINSQPAGPRRRLGMPEIRRSTLSDALAVRNVATFAAAAQFLIQAVNRRARQGAAQLLYLLDSTSITLKGRGFDSWTQESRTRNTQGIKLHVLTHQGAPLSYNMSPANVNDISQAKHLQIEPGATYVFDKGYCDYNWYKHIQDCGAYFVTRFKYNANLSVQSTNPISEEDSQLILADEFVCFANQHARSGRKNEYTQALRRIRVARPGKSPLVLATNDMSAPAAVVAQHYKDRWGVELFFKWIKQHLKIKTFLGCSENAVQLQIVVALIIYLLLVLYQQAKQCGQSLWMLLSQLSATLFQVVQRPKSTRPRPKSDKPPNTGFPTAEGAI